MKQVTENSYLVALDIAEKLVQKKIPFRTTHKIAGKLVQKAHLAKKQLSKLTPDEIESCIKDTSVDIETISEIIKNTTVTSSLRQRTSRGSSGFSEQKRMIIQRVKRIDIARMQITKRDNEVSLAIKQLEERVSELVK